MDPLKNMAQAGEFCLQEAILTALARKPEGGLSVRKIAHMLGIKGPGRENVIEGHLEHRLKNNKRVEVYAREKDSTLWTLTKEERTRRGG